MTKAWSGRFAAGAASHRRAVHRLARVRSPALAARHPGQPGLGPGPRAGRAPHPARARGHRRRARAHPGRAGGRDRFPSARSWRTSTSTSSGACVELIGPAGGKLHTGRSRNDQIALDERLYLKDVCDGVSDGLREVQRALIGRAAESLDVAMPGYTHLQRAQPILLAHHLLAYVFMLERDRGRLAACRARTDVLPLGAAALAGTAFPIDREALAARPRLRRGGAEQPRRGERPRLRAGIPGRRRHHRHAPVAAGRRPHPVGHRGVRLRGDRRRLRHRILDHAAEEEPRRGGADPRQERAALRQPDGRAHDDEGPAPHLQLGHAGRQGAALRLRRHPGGHSRRAAAHAGHPDASGPSACAGPPARTSRRPPTWPTTSSARGCPSARPTRWWGASCATGSSRGATSWSSRWTSCGASPISSTTT